MSLTPGALSRRLAELEDVAGTPERYVIALSGGLDSTVLTHLLATSQPKHKKPILLVHVDHGLQAESQQWAEHCAGLARQLGLEIVLEQVTVEDGAGDGPEAAARTARYAALQKHVGSRDWLCSAHHQDDQGETLLLNLLRGSGPVGVAGMSMRRRCGKGWLVRPLLDISREDLQAYAEAEQLTWIDDPSNSDDGLDRNFLRTRVLPVLHERWPHAARKFARSADLARESAELLDVLADIDMDAMAASPERLSVAGLRSLSRDRQKNVLRRATRRAGLSTPAAVHLRVILDELLPARADAEPHLRWSGGEARRFRRHLYLLPEMAVASFRDGAPLTSADFDVGPGLGHLSLVQGGRPGLSPPVIQAGLRVRRRQGGEEIKPVGHAHTRKLKKLLQDEAVLPWRRNELPLIYAGDELVAVADLWLAESAVAEEGVAIEWVGRPNLY